MNRKSQLHLILLFVLLVGVLFVQDTASSSRKIVAHWAVYHSYDEDSVVYVPADSSFATGLDMHNN